LLRLVIDWLRSTFALAAVSLLTTLSLFSSSCASFVCRHAKVLWAVLFMAFYLITVKAVVWWEYRKKERTFLKGLIDAARVRMERVCMQLPEPWAAFCIARFELAAAAVVFKNRRDEENRQRIDE
jgi:hypothetical protein